MSDALQDALSGAVGAVVSTISVYPLDVAKTRLQAQTRNVQRDGSARSPRKSRATSPPPSPMRTFCLAPESDDDEDRRIKGEHRVQRMVSGAIPYFGTVDCLRRIVQEEGFPRLFVGLQPKCIYSALTNFVFFYLLRTLRPVLGRTPMLQGISAGVGVQLVVLPLDMIVVRLQSARGVTASFLQVFKSIIKDDGFLGLWAGLGAGMSLTLNPGINQRVLSVLLGDKRPSSAMAAFWTAALAKAIASTATYPLVRAKVHMQVHRIVADEASQRNTVQVLSRMVADDGLLAVFDGLSLQLGNAVLKEAILLMVQTKIVVFVARALSFMRRAH